MELTTLTTLITFTLPVITLAAARVWVWYTLADIDCDHAECELRHEALR